MKKILLTLFLIFSAANSFGATVKSEVTTGSVASTDLASMTSAQLATVVSDETGSGSATFATAPTLNNPVISDYANISPASTPSTPGSGVSVYTSNTNSDPRAWLSWKNALGKAYDVQPTFGSCVVGGWYAPGNTATFSANGVGATYVGNTARSPANTNLATAVKRVAMVSAASAGSSAGVRTQTNTWQIGNSSLPTGFNFSIKFSISDSIATGNLFAGLSNTTTAFGDIDPSTITNAIGVCAIANDTTLNICYGGSAAQTPIDLGANFPANTDLTDLYEFSLYAPANGTVIYRLRRLNTGDEVFGLLNGTLGTQLPNYNTMLSPQIYRSNGGTASAAEVGVYELFIQTCF